jgi:hypothetical protein
MAPALTGASPLLVRPAAIRRYALERAPALRFHKFTRVSKELVSWADGLLRARIDAVIQQHSTRGKTILPP